MKLILANPRGFCAGVYMAIDVVDQLLDICPDDRICVYHEIVHNRHVVDRFKRRGVTFVESIDEVPDGSIVVFSAHGVSPAIREEARRKNLTAIDATCPLVTKVHAEAIRYARKGYQILLIGHAHHQEVVGTCGEAPDAIQVVESPADIPKLTIKDPSKLAYLTQTTLSLDDARRIIDALKVAFPQIKDPPSEDICYATTNRQAAVKELARQCDLVLVVGSPTSSNSNRLREVAELCGATAYLVESVAEVDLAWLEGRRAVGITAGASTPEHLVQDIVRLLEARGAGPARDLEAVPEDMFFHLPSDLARDLEASGRAAAILEESGRTLRSR
jgi:4-hydroxy-3-methylbut-2-enyl diphosphate reductase